MKGQMEMQPDHVFYPDANLTLRVSYGTVEGYHPLDGVYYEPISTIDGIMEKDNPDIYDYNIPQRLRDLYKTKDYGRWGVNGSVPVCFMATNHTTGGNSGSPVVNRWGELIGINSVKFISEDVEGMGYAIPISDVESIIGNLMNKETRDKVDDAQKGYLGISNMVDVTDDVSKNYNMPVGVYVKTVLEGLGSDKAGMQDGDIITLNYAGTVDGVAFDGGTAENQQLVIGSHTFIDNFEEQLIGVEIGGEKDVEVTFPEEYHAPDLAGKAAVFHVEVLGIKEKQLPEIDDDFAQDTTEFDTLEEYKNDIKEKLATAKEEQAKSAAENALIEQIVESSEMDIPDAMVDFQVDQMVDEFKQRLSYQGLSLEQYVQFSGQNMDALRENMKGDALKRVQGSLVLEAIVAAENIEANEEDLKKEFEKMAQMYQMEASQIEGMIPEEQKENMKKDIAVQKAVEFVLDQANVTEATEELDFEEK